MSDENIEVDDAFRPEAQKENPDVENQELMCWKDPNKHCLCKHPRAGIFCGRYPLPTD